MKLIVIIWSYGIARGIVLLVSMMLLLRWFPLVGSKLMLAAIILVGTTGVYREWRVYVRPTRTLFAIHRIRAARFLKRLRRVPPDVPFLYGFVLMFATGWFLLMACNVKGTSMHVFLIVLEALIAIAALRQGWVAIRTIVKQTWSKLIGKALYAVATWLAWLLARGDAIATVRSLTHADAKYFPTFVGVMSGPFAVFRLLQFASLLAALCALLLIVASWPRLVIKMLSDTPLIRRALRRQHAEPSRLSLPDVIGFFGPVGLLLVAVGLSMLPKPAMELLDHFELPARLLAATEYVDDDSCANIAPSLRTQHLGDNRVSVLEYKGRKPVFSQLKCENAG